MSLALEEMNLAALRAAYIGPANEAAIAKLPIWARDGAVQKILDLARADGMYLAMGIERSEKDTREWLAFRNARSVSFGP